MKVLTLENDYMDINNFLIRESCILLKCEMNLRRFKFVCILIKYKILILEVDNKYTHIISYYY